MAKSQHIPEMVINTTLVEMVQIEIDESATIESEDTPYIVYAYFVSGRSVVIGRFETEEAAIECMESVAKRMKGWNIQ